MRGHAGDRCLSRAFLPATLIVVAVILHGSLYPYDFRVPPGEIGPVATLLGSWADVPGSYSDIIANFVLYAPFGFFAGLTIRGGHLARLFVVTSAGLLLCTGVELAQYYDAGRLTSMSDVYLNSMGSAAGAVAAVWLGGSDTRHWPMAAIAANPFPLLLLIAMLGYHLFPYVPTIDMRKYVHALRPLVVAPQLSAADLLRYAALWLTASWLIGTMTGFARSRHLVPLFMAAVFAAKVAIVDLIVTPSEVIGAALALALWLAIGGRGRVAALFTAVVLCSSIVIGRLQPFHFEAVAHGFGWLPFRAFLYGSIRVDTMAFLEKSFLYGSLVWLAAEAGLPFWQSALVVAVLLFVTSVAETHLPGRSAEITDALMVVIIALVMAPFRRQPPPPMGEPDNRRCRILV